MKVLLQALEHNNLGIIHHRIHNGLLGQLLQLVDPRLNLGNVMARTPLGRRQDLVQRGARKQIRVDGDDELHHVVQRQVADAVVDIALRVRLEGRILDRLARGAALADGSDERLLQARHGAPDPVLALRAEVLEVGLEAVAVLGPVAGGIASRAALEGLLGAARVEVARLGGRTLARRLADGISGARLAAAARIAGEVAELGYDDG